MLSRHFPLTIALPLAVGVLVVLALGAAYLGSIRNGNTIIEKSIVNTGRTLMSTSSHSLFNRLYTLDVDGINIELRGFTREEHVIYAAVRDGTGRLVSASSNGWSPGELASQRLSSDALGQGEIVHRSVGQFLILSGPITAGSEQIGTLEIAFDKGPLQASLESEQRDLLYLMIILATIAVVILAIVIRYAVKPLGTLSAAAQEIGSGNLGNAVPVGGSKEMVTLASVMEQMRVNLKQVYFGLEQRVEERTQELSLANDRLSRSLADLEQFTNIASQDLQEPIRIVSNFVQLLEARHGDALDSDAKELIGYAVDGTKRMQSQIKDLLEYSRVTQQGIDFGPVDCSMVFRQAINTLGNSIQSAEVVVTCDELPTILGVGSQVVSVFRHIIGNGVKYRGPQSPRIHISAMENNDDWLFSFEDNGIGIEPEYFDRIFVIFQRLHGREAYSGTGIGLAVCKKIIDVHGGRIWVESEPGKGCTFYFTLPKV